VAYYPFNGNAIDESGNGNHGTVYGATLSTDRFGNANKAYIFNNNSIQVANSSSLNPTTISISLWFLSTGTNMNLISKNNPNDATSVSFKITLDDFQVIQRGLQIGFGRGVCNSVGDYFSYWSPFGAIQQNVWNNLIVTIRSNGQISCYINGSLSFTSNGDFNKNSPCNNNASILKIGGPWWNSDPEYFKGKIDDIRIYERVLTSEEINYISTH
jgi:protein associated with RNAse G/E